MLNQVLMCSGNVTHGVTLWQSPVMFVTGTLAFIFNFLEGLNPKLTGVNRLGFLIPVCSRL